MEILGIANTIQTGNGRDDNDIAPARQQGRSGAQAQLLNFIVDGQILLNIGIGNRQIGFRLIIIVIRHKIFHRVVWEKLTKFTVQLSSKGLVVTQHQYRAVELRNDVGHRKGLSRTRYAQ